MGITKVAKTHINQWCIVDATDQVLGRLAAGIAKRLRGKHLPNYTSHAAMGDAVIVIHADKVRVTGRKKDQKFYHHHTGYPGGLKSVNFSDMLAKYPERIIEHAVYGMLPKNCLGRQLRRRLYVYAGAEHQHQAQQPISCMISNTTNQSV